MRGFAAVLLTGLLAASSAFATPVDMRAPLAPGKPAGVKQAQFENSNTLLIVAGVGIVAAGIALAASGDNNTITSVATTASSATTTNTTTTTTRTTSTTG